MANESENTDHGEIVSGLLCRRVKYSDKKAITMDINCYEGRDYMYSHFDKYIHGSAAFPCPMFCGIKDGILVSTDSGCRYISIKSEITLFHLHDFIMLT